MASTMFGRFAGRPCLLARLPSLVHLLPNAENDATIALQAAPHVLIQINSQRLIHGSVSNLDPLINNPALSNSVFVIVFDEGLDSDTTHGGANSCGDSRLTRQGRLSIS